MVFAITGDLPRREAVLYAVAQVAGGIVGTIVAHLMFALPLVAASQHVRTGGAQWFAEFVATFGLVRDHPGRHPLRARERCPGWSGSTSPPPTGSPPPPRSPTRPSRSRASLTDTFSGIRPVDLPGFVAAQLVGALCGMALLGLAAARTGRPARPHQSRGPAMTVTIYHNPACGTSRNTLAMIRATGTEPTIIEYLKTPPTRAELLDLVQRMGMPLRDVLRRKGTPYDELGLDDPSPLRRRSCSTPSRRTPS